MAEQVPAVSAVLFAIECRDWRMLRRLLDPDVLWTTAVEEDLHGPDEVVARLARDPPPAPPAYHDVRAGRITRWIDTPG